MSTESRTRPPWLHLFPELLSIGDEVWLRAVARAKQARLPANTRVFREGEECEHYIFVLDGSTKVFKTFKSGREIVLYRLRTGQTCSLTTCVLLAGGTYPADADTEQETDAVLLPREAFFEAFDGSQEFRKYVCGVFGGRIRDMIMLLEAVTFRRVDVRLAKWLLEYSDPEGEVVASHRELAFELGTAREVISRQLNEFQNNGWVELDRKRILIKDEESLNKLLHRFHA